MELGFSATAFKQSKFKHTPAESAVWCARTEAAGLPTQTDSPSDSTQGTLDL